METTMSVIGSLFCILVIVALVGSYVILCGTVSDISKKVDENLTYMKSFASAWDAKIMADKEKEKAK